MSADPFRLRVLKALTAVIENVGQQADDINNLQGVVFRGREWFGDDEPLPMVSLLEPPLSVDRLPSTEANPDTFGDWDILVQGWVKDDKKNPCDPAYQLCAEVIRVVALEREKWRGPGKRNLLGEGDSITEIVIGSPIVRPPDTTSMRACFYLILTLRISETLTDPFN